MELGIIAQSCENHLGQLLEGKEKGKPGKLQGEGKAEKICKEIISKVNSFPKENDAGVDFDVELEAIRSLYRRIQSKLGAAPLSLASTTPSTDW